MFMCRNICCAIYIRMYNMQFKLANNEKQKRIIPLNLFQTWQTKTNLPPRMQESIETLVLDNPEFKYYLFDDDDCREYVKNNYDSHILEAYDTLKPGAYKADLWRYCILYKLGGIYLDIKYQCVRGFKLVSLVEEEHFVRDMYNTENLVGVYNAFMVCSPGNEIMMKCINKVVENVKMRYYGDNSLMVTGPRMMINLFTLYDKRKLDEMYHTDDVLSEYYIVYKGVYILKIYTGYRMEQKNTQFKSHYGELWDKKDIYIN
jgi:mannosyltransferase OCH1-like enzyme